MILLIISTFGKSIFSTDSLVMTSEEYLEMSEDARKAVEKNYKVIIKRR